MGDGVLRIEFDGLLVAGDGLVQPPLGLQRQAQAGVGLGQLRIGFDGLPVAGDGLVQPPLHFQSIAEVVVRLGILRVDGDGLLEAGDGLVRPAIVAECIAQVIARPRAVRPQRDGNRQETHRLPVLGRRHHLKRDPQVVVEPEVGRVVFLCPPQQAHRTRLGADGQQPAGQARQGPGRHFPHVRIGRQLHQGRGPPGRGPVLPRCPQPPRPAVLRLGGLLHGAQPLSLRPGDPGVR